MTSMLLKILAWLSLAALVVVTLGHIDVRPITLISANVERLAAFAVVGLLFGVAYPRRHWAIAIAIVATALGLEALQSLSPTRHGEILDSAIKISGGIVGLASSSVILRVMRVASR
ncbi:MAG: VanZ family protein [Alphaproteobacteria bacterium]